MEMMRRRARSRVRARNEHTPTGKGKETQEEDDVRARKVRAMRLLASLKDAERSLPTPWVPVLVVFGGMVIVAFALCPEGYAQGLLAIIVAVHILARWVRARRAASRRLHLPNPLLQPLPTTAATEEESELPPICCITGGCGFFGTELVRLFVAKRTFRVRVVDICHPSPLRRVAGVDYRIADLVRDDLQDAFEGCTVVVHTAGVVDLTSDGAATFNCHCVGTARVVNAARASGARCFVQTSSNGAVTSPFYKGSVTDGSAL